MRASNRDVARETGITPGLIYYYFENKEALLRTILEERSPMQTIAQISPEMLKQPLEVLLPALITWLLSVVEGKQLVSILRMALPEILYKLKTASIVLRLFQRILGSLEQ